MPRKPQQPRKPTGFELEKDVSAPVDEQAADTVADAKQAATSAGTAVEQTPTESESEGKTNGANSDVDMYIIPKRPRRPRFEESHTRETLWLLNENSEILSRIAAGERGEKTRIINEALQMYFRKNYKRKQ